jgi:hypothetical protein
MTKPAAWEVWLAHVVFEDGIHMKKCPVIILDENSNFITAIELTSRPPKYADEFILSDWMHVGLKTPPPPQRMPSQSQRTHPQRTSQKDGCYIATSVYGSYDSPQV